MRPGAFFAGNYIWATEQARAEFVTALAEAPSKVTGMKPTAFGYVRRVVVGALTRHRDLAERSDVRASASEPGTLGDVVVVELGAIPAGDRNLLKPVRRAGILPADKACWGDLSVDPRQNFVALIIKAVSHHLGAPAEPGGMQVLADSATGFY
jgi:hypothetical protein